MRTNADGASVIVGALAGLLGGLAASFVMNQVMAGLALATHRTEPGTDPQRAKQMLADRKSRFRQIADPTGEVSNSAARRVLGRELTPREREASGPLVHYLFGALAGAAYGVAAEFAPKTTTGRGLGYGVAIWAFGAEVAVPALGLARKPTEIPLQAHAAMLASHAAYGVALETVRRRVRELAL